MPDKEVSEAKQYLDAARSRLPTNTDISLAYSAMAQALETGRLADQTALVVERLDRLIAIAERDRGVAQDSIAKNPQCQWIERREYLIGNIVYVRWGWYVCTQAHVSNEFNKPVDGQNGHDYWQLSSQEAS